MSEPKYSHLLEVDEARMQIVLHRIDAHGNKTLYTEVPVLSVEDAAQDDLSKWFETLGEIVALDSPALRRLLKL